MAGIGFAFEAWNQVDKQLQIEKFNNNKKIITEFFEEQRKELIEQIDSIEFFEEHFSNYILLKEELNNSIKEIEKLKKYRTEFIEWSRQGKRIMGKLNQL